MNIKPIRPAKQTRPRHVMHGPLMHVSGNGHSAPRTHTVEPKMTPEQRKNREAVEAMQRLMAEYARELGVTLDVSDVLARGAICGALYQLQQRDPAAVGAIAGVTFSDAAADLLEQRDHVADASQALIRVNPKALNELSVAQRWRVVVHEVAHAYLKHSQQARSSAVIEREAWALAARWGF